MRRLHHLLAAGALALPLAALIAGGAAAQSVSGRDLRVRADDTLEWHREEQKYIARGNATVTLGDRRIEAGELVAYYRKIPGADTNNADARDTTMEIYRIEASGGVTLKGEHGTVMGARGVYDLDASVMVLTGTAVRLTTDTGVALTSGDRMEYWPKRNLVVARGQARAKSDGRKLEARVIQAVFSRPEGDAPPKLKRLEAFDAVRIATQDGRARGDMGIYDPDSRVAELFGDVVLRRGGTELRGGYAKIEMDGGTSQLRAAPPGESGEERVRGLVSEPALDHDEAG